MKRWTKKDVCNAVLLAGYIMLFWYLASYFPVAFDWAASWTYKITGSKVTIIIIGALLLMFFSVIYAFAKIQGEFFGPIKKIKKEDDGRSTFVIQKMKTPIWKQLISETYVNLIFFIIGLATLIALYGQIQNLGYEIFNTEPQKPFEYAKEERNITNLLLFSVISVSGIAYGLIGICKSLRILKRCNEENK